MKAPRENKSKLKKIYVKKTFEIFLECCMPQEFFIWILQKNTFSKKRT